jgi:ABC-type glycerol-3-phosphate transport system permease component
MISLNFSMKGFLFRSGSIIYFILGIIGLSTIFPVINTVAISLSNSSKASSNLVTFFSIGFNVESYKNIQNRAVSLTDIYTTISS